MSTLFVLLILFTSISPLLAQLRTQVNLVLVPVTVIDRRGASVTGLAREDFTILEDNLPQRIVSFSLTDAPCSVGMILDVSGSMQRTLTRAKLVAEKFLSAADPEDDLSLSTVSTRPESDSGFTSDFAALKKAVLLAKPGGWTALIDTIYLGMNRVRKARNDRRALLIISDGMDNHSRYTQNELMRVAMEADIQIYTVAVGELPRNRKPIELGEERKGLSLLREMAERTGGLHLVAATPGDAGEVAARISSALRNQYVIGYQPPDTNGTDKWHTIKVQLNSRNAAVYSRTKYYR